MVLSFDLTDSERSLSGPVRYQVIYHAIALEYIGNRQEKLA
jgi:hypothetical protein